MAGRSRHLSTIEALSRVLRWEVKVSGTEGCVCARVSFLDRTVFFTRAGDRRMHEHSFVAKTRQDALDRIDGLLSLGVTARVHSCPSGMGYLPALEWTIPPISSPEDVVMRMSFGQHTAWKPTPVPE